MNTMDDVLKKIDEIKNTDFKIRIIKDYDKEYIVANLLGSAQSCRNSIYNLNGVSEHVKTELYNNLNEIMKNKFRKLNPTLNKEIINNMIYSYHRGIIKIPMDIIVLDDAVINKEIEVDDFGGIHNAYTFMFNPMPPYNNISSELYIFGYEIEEVVKGIVISREEEKSVANFITKNINSLYKKDVIKNSGVFFSTVRGISININRSFYDILKSIKLKEESDIKICILNNDDIVLYYIHQSFNNDEVIWNLVKTNSDIWSLTDEISKLENKQKVLTKNENSRIY